MKKLARKCLTALVTFINVNEKLKIKEKKKRKKKRKKEKKKRKIAINKQKKEKAQLKVVKFCGDIRNVVKMGDIRKWVT
jgi:hypothetical protein